MQTTEQTSTKTAPLARGEGAQPPQAGGGKTLQQTGNAAAARITDWAAI